VVGDAVNMAQRLEVLGKTLLPDAETAILLSADTRRGLDASTSVRSLGQHAIRGREGQVEVFTLDEKK
jgi:adenylate cyclase